MNHFSSTDNIEYLLDKIVEVIPAPQQLEGTPQMLITSLDYSNYTGRIAVGRVHRGTLKDGMQVTISHRDGSQERTKIKELHTFEGMGHQKTDHVDSGDICAVIGLEKFEIGDTICDLENPEPLPPIAIDEPTMSMLFTINDSPFFGKEGKYCTSRHIGDRLQRELEKNLALRVQPFEDSTDAWVVSGRGVLHLSVLIETMRREGYELQVGQPQVIYKEIDGQKCEPIEELTINVPEEFSSKMIDMVTRRKGELTSMESQGDRVNIEFDIPSRGIIGLRTNVLTASQGEAIMAHRYKEYQPYKGDIQRRQNGSMIHSRPVRPMPMPSTSCRIAASSSSIRVRRSIWDRSSASMCTTTTLSSTSVRPSSSPTCVLRVPTTRLASCRRSS